MFYVGAWGLETSLRSAVSHCGLTPGPSVHRKCAWRSGEIRGTRFPLPNKERRGLATQKARLVEN